MSGLDEIRLQVMWSRLIAVVEEQARALVRAAFSPSVREAGDLSAGVYTKDGRMIAQAVTGTPGHVNAMADSVRHFILEIAEMKEGDVYLTNDPWKATGHLHDVTVVTPVFRGGALVGFFGSTAHVVDIGGRGFGADADSLFEEGLQLPIMRLFDAGEIDRTLIAILRANVRQPDQLIGDLHALASANRIGERRLAAMLDEYGESDLERLAEMVFERSKSATEKKIAALPRGSASNVMEIDGHSSPVRLEASLKIGERTVEVDFTGTSPADPKGVNVPLVYTKAYACYALKCAIAPEIPNNHASLAPFVVTSPPGTITAARRPDPVALRHVIGHMIPDVVFGALDRLVPDRAPAEGAGALCNFQLSLEPISGIGERAEVLVFNSGGAGARPGLDGLSATAFPSGVTTMPIEASEHAGPILFWRKELRPDSGGAGKRRGGLGQSMEVGARPGWRFSFSAMFDRIDHPARGRRGGGEGAPTVVRLASGTKLRGKGKQKIPDGERVVLELPGGGGWGDPADRDREEIARDLERGYVTPEQAKKLHGWEDDAE